MKKRILSFFICVLVLVSAILALSSCDVQKAKNEKEQPKSTQNISEEEKSKGQNIILGQGKTMFFFDVTDLNGNKTSFEVNTDKKLLGDALKEHNLISGEEGDYGLYVNTVNGVLADASKGEYWILYIGGESSMTGVDQVEIKSGETYEFKVEKY